MSGTGIPLFKPLPPITLSTLLTGSSSATSSDETGKAQPASNERPKVEERTNFSNMTTQDRLRELEKMRQEQLKRLQELQDQLNRPQAEPESSKFQHSGTSAETEAAQQDEDDDDESWRADAEAFLAAQQQQTQQLQAEDDSEDKPQKQMMQMMMMTTMQQMMQNMMKLQELQDKKEKKKMQTSSSSNAPPPPPVLEVNPALPSAFHRGVMPATVKDLGMTALQPVPAFAIPGNNLPAGILAAKAKEIEGFDRDAWSEAARELQAAQEAAAAQQAAFEQMTPEQQAAVYQAMTSASEAQKEIQKQFQDQLIAHEAQKLKESGYYLNNQPERFKDGYRPLRMCKHYPTGDCWRGNECTFAHVLEELHPASPDLPRTVTKSTNALAEQQRIIDSAPDVRLKKKKALCDKWKNQDCVLGRACPYAHGEAELGTVELVICGKVKTKICKFWTRGNCMFPENCVNAHGEQELGLKRPEFLTPPMKKRREGESIDEFRNKVIKKN